MRIHAVQLLAAAAVIYAAAANPEDVLVPEAPLRQEMVSGDQSGVIRDVMRHLPGADQEDDLLMGESEAEAMSALMRKDSTVKERVQAMEKNFLEETSDMSAHSMEGADIKNALTRVSAKDAKLDMSTCKCYMSKKLTECFKLPIGGRLLCDDIQLKMRSGASCHYKYYGVVAHMNATCRTPSKQEGKAKANPKANPKAKHKGKRHGPPAVKRIYAKAVQAEGKKKGKKKAKNLKNKSKYWVEWRGLGLTGKTGKHKGKAHGKAVKKAVKKTVKSAKSLKNKSKIGKQKGKPRGKAVKMKVVKPAVKRKIVKKKAVVKSRRRWGSLFISTWKVCADKEGVTCKCRGRVLYGRKFKSGRPGRGKLATVADMLKAVHVIKEARGHITCSNGALADPLVGYYKRCMCKADDADWGYH